MTSTQATDIILIHLEVFGVRSYILRWLQLNLEDRYTTQMSCIICKKLRLTSDFMRLILYTREMALAACMALKK